MDENGPKWTKVDKRHATLSILVHFGPFSSIPSIVDAAYTILQGLVQEEGEDPSCKFHVP